MLMSVIVFMLPLSIAEMKASCNSGGSEICNLLDFSNEPEKREADADFKHKRFHCLVIFHIKTRSNKILVTWGALVCFKQGAISPLETEGTFCPGTSNTQRISVLHVHDLLTKGCNSPAPS